jgi:hypothetical protein
MDFHTHFTVNYVRFRPQRRKTTFTHSVTLIARGHAHTAAIRGSLSASRPRQLFGTNFDAFWRWILSVLTREGVKRYSPVL